MPDDSQKDLVAGRGERRSRLLGIAVAIAISGVSVWGAASFQRDPPPAPVPTPGMTVENGSVRLVPEAPQWKAIRLEPAAPDTVRRTDPIPARVKIDETRASRVGTPLAGRVTAVSVELGQVVHAGDPLFTVASPDIAELRAQREKAAVDLQAARAVLDRVRAMVANHSLPAKEQAAAEQQYREAEVAQRLALAKLASLKVTSRAQNEFVVTAPQDGVVVEKNVLVGQQVTPDGGPLLVVADLSTVWVVADLFEADAVDVREGTKAVVTSPSLLDTTREGIVEMVSSVVDPMRHTVPIRVRLSNPDRKLRPNMYARVQFDVPPRTGAVEVPVSALVSDGQGQYVYVQDQRGRFVRREVVCGPTHGGVVTVFQGLSVGDVVVVEGGILLDNQIALAE